MLCDLSDINLYVRGREESPERTKKVNRIKNPNHNKSQFKHVANKADKMLEIEKEIKSFQ